MKKLGYYHSDAEIPFICIWTEVDLYVVPFAQRGPKQSFQSWLKVDLRLSIWMKASDSGKRRLGCHIFEPKWFRDVRGIENECSNFLILRSNSVCNVKENHFNTGCIIWKCFTYYVSHSSRTARMMEFVARVCHSKVTPCKHGSCSGFVAQGPVLNVRIGFFLTPKYFPVEIGLN